MPSPYPTAGLSSIDLMIFIQDDDSLVAYILEKDFWIRIWEPTLYLENLFDMETRDSFKQ